jgi:putative spermidine/putrescine transport system permease protein
MKGLARGAIVAAVGVLALVPLLVLVLESVEDQWFYPAILPVGYTLGGWRLAFSGALAPATVTSLAVAVATAVLGTALALPIGRALARLAGWRRHAAAAAVFLPVAAPPLALGTGLQVGLLAIGAGGTTAGVLAAHLVPAVGYLSLYFLGVFTLRDPRPELEARTLGATPWQTWTLVTLPTLRRPIADALGLGFLISWTQFALTLVVGGGTVRALPLEVYAFVRAGQDRPAAVGALLLVIPALAMLASLRWVAGHELATPS